MILVFMCVKKKYGNCSGKLQEMEGPALSEKLLKQLEFDDDISKRVQYLIAHHHTYDHVDGIDYQILIEADFLVNLYEDGVSKEAVKKLIIVYLKQITVKPFVEKCLEYR